MTVSNYLFVARAKNKRMELAKFSYQLGCEQNAVGYCPTLKDENTRNACYDYGAKICPVGAQNYVDWLRGK